MPITVTTTELSTYCANPWPPGGPDHASEKFSGRQSTSRMPRGLVKMSVLDLPEENDEQEGQHCQRRPHHADELADSRPRLGRRHVVLRRASTSVRFRVLMRPEPFWSRWRTRRSR